MKQWERERIQTKPRVKDASKADRTDTCHAGGSATEGPVLASSQPQPALSAFPTPVQPHQFVTFPPFPALPQNYPPFLGPPQNVPPFPTPPPKFSALFASQHRIHGTNVHPECHFLWTKFRFPKLCHSSTKPLSVLSDTWTILASQR